MSWLYSQALVEEYLGASCSDGEPSVQSNGSSTQQAYCAPDKMTGFSRLSQFGMTYKPLTASLGKELLTLYLEDFHAKTSAAGKGAGIDGERSGMWREMARIIHEVRPRYAFVENSPMLTSRGLGTVLGDLASMGFDARWGVLGAVDVGANHKRDRIWIVAKQMGNSDHNGQVATKVREVFDEGSNNKQAGPEQTSKSQRPSEQYAEMADTSQLFSNGGNDNARVSLEREAQTKSGNDCWAESVSNSHIPQQQRGSVSSRVHQKNTEFGDSRWWETEPDVGRVADGVVAWVDRLKAIGNGQVPLCAATAWQILSKDI
jgi:DNA (cytosine-5)-methyltransferase 1